MSKIPADLEASIQERIEADTDFQNEIASLSDEEKTQKIDERMAVEVGNEFTGLKTKAEKAEKAEELANNYKIRAEKAEKALKGNGGGEASKVEATLSPKDYLALTENKISSEDFDEVVRVAGLLGKTVSEGLKDSTLKAIIAGRVEERQTAIATQTKSPRGASRVSGDALMERASKGELPEKDEDIAKLAEAEEAAKKARLRR